MIRSIYLFVLLCLTAFTVQGQVIINEIMASNTRSYPDITDFEDYPDWFELKNTSASPVSLDGYFISDDASDPYKWPVPAGATIPANGFLLIMADGHDAAPGQTFPRGYWPWKNFVTEKYHTNFSLSADGEGLVLTKGTGLGSVNLVNASTPTPVDPDTVAIWKYKDDGSDQSTQWRARIFDDSAWATGPSELGYGDAPATTVSFGPSATNKYRTTYFRHHFTVNNPAIFYGLNLRLLVDDGCIVYLNGQEVVRRNMPSGTVNYQTLADTSVAGTAENTFYPYTIPVSALVAGDNVLAVEVHQSAVDSGDLSLDIGLVGLTVSGSTTTDAVSFGTQVSDVSYGRDAITPSTWKHFAEATPGAENLAGAVSNIRDSGYDVTVSLAGGFYSEPQLAMLSSDGGPIHYTLDGSNPTTSSPLYAAPIPITTTTVLRARCFALGKAPGQIATRTYFFGETMTNVPYVSVVADPNTLFGNTIGIYTNQHETVSGTYGLKDVYKGKDAPGNVEFFAPGGGGFNAGGGIRIGGENNWVHPQKALNFAIRSKYGTEDVTYDLFPGTKVPIHTAFTLRDGGDNWNKDMLRDCIFPSLTQGFMNVDVAEYRPTVVFINGAYWGIHDLRPRWDETWFAQKYHIPADRIDHLLYAHNTSPAVTLGADKGTTEAWLELMAFINTADLTVQANWDFVESKIDMDSFMDFVIAESYGNNSSWLHNREFWKEKSPGAKWRWFLTDMDRTFSLSRLTGTLSDMVNNDDVLVRLKANVGFKQRLAQRYAAHMASTFAEARVQAVVTAMDTEVAAHIPRHVTRWAPGGTTETLRNNNIAEIKAYATQRVANFAGEVALRLGVGAAVDLTLAVNDPAQGTIRVQGVPVAPGTFKMFPNIPFTVEAVPAPGYAFGSWTGVAGGAATSATITGAATISALFIPSGETVVGGTLAGDTTFTAANSPYALSDDLIVPPGVTLTVQPGVTILMPTGRNLRVKGAIHVQGTGVNPVTIRGRGSERWGGISMESPTGQCTLAHLFVRGATRGYDPTLYSSAIMARNGDVIADFVDMEENDTTFYMYNCTSIIRDCRFHIPYTGDGLHIKKGSSIVQRCIFPGNNSPDTDGIDFDAVTSGVIEDCRMYRFQGFNSDGIDLGEACSNVLVQRNLIYFNSDKGFSVGQGSVVTLRKNLVVGCPLGVGIKDAGSVATIDQNTFASCNEGIAMYEKNFGDGGGSATITNNIFSRSTEAPISIDSFSTATISYCLSDTLALPGIGNRLTDPRFVDPIALNFQLQPTSPAINTGDPAHALDPDGTRVDIGAAYLYSPADYPFTIGETIVINELLANSGAASDWIELHNRLNSPVDIGGWFLSDSALDLQKYRIPVGTIIPAGGYVVFTEAANFGTASVDPNKITAFAFSDIGETVYLSSATGDQLTDYQTREDFGATTLGETLGTYYKPSSDSVNFVAMQTATPGAPNSRPRVGPIVISEIMYNPSGSGTGDAEYIELLNVSNAPVTLFDPAKGKAWRISDGVDFEFPAATPVVMAPRERVVLTKNLILFNNVFGASVPPGTKVFEFTTASLSNGGETLQLDRPGAVDALNEVQFVRQDRVNYDDAFPWPTAPDGTGASLTKIIETDYGNDHINWMAASPTPGSSCAQTPPDADNDGLPDAWEVPRGLKLSDPSDATVDVDGDGQSFKFEFTAGTDPFDANDALRANLMPSGGTMKIRFTAVAGKSYTIQFKDDLGAQNWSKLIDVPAGNITQELEVGDPSSAGELQRFYRIVTPQAP